MTDELPERVVKVKPLEWNQNDELPSLANAVGCGVLYCVVKRITGKGSLRINNMNREHSEHESVEAAKAAAQADYEQRILSALAPATPSPASQTQEGTRMDDDLNKRVNRVVKALKETVLSGPPSWSQVPVNPFGAEAIEIITALRARLDAVTQERDELEGANILNRTAVRLQKARAEKAEAALAEALREREIGITEGDIVAYMNVASLHGELLATKAALADARRQALEEAAQTVESLWAYRTCAEVAEAVRALPDKTPAEILAQIEERGE